MALTGWDIAEATATSIDDDGFLVVQSDPLGDDAIGSPDVEVHHPLGLLARPRDPDDGGSANVLTAREGNRTHAWICGDPRVTGLLPPLETGGLALYASPVPGRSRPTCTVVYGSTGTWQTLVPYGSAAHALTLDVATEGQESIRLDHGAGMGLTLTAGGKFSSVLRNRHGDAYVEVNDDGVSMNGNVQIIGAVVLGTQTPSLAQSFAMATPLAAWIAQVVAWMASAVSACAPKGIALPAPPPAPAGLASVMTKGL